LERGGGIQQFLLNLLEAPRPADLEIHVAHTHSQAGSLLNDVQARGVEVWRAALPVNPRSSRRAFAAALRERAPYDVVHTHVYNLGGPLLAAARQAGVPVRLAHYHNIRPGHRNDWPRRIYERWMRSYVSAHATGICGCSWAALCGFFPRDWMRDERMRVIRYGVDVARFAGGKAQRAAVRTELGLPADALVVGHIGRFVHQKNHATLLKAAQAVARALPDARFVLIGDGPLQTSVGAQVQSAGLAERVRLVGRRDDVPRLLAAIDVMVLPSLWEGHPMVLIEAQCAGVPVVASDIPASREAVAPEFHRYFHRPTDDAGLARALLELGARGQREPGVREAAREFGRQFPIEASWRGMLCAWRYPGAEPPPDPCGWAGPGGARTLSARERGVVVGLGDATSVQPSP